MSSEAKKSRSKKRRERRKAAKAAAASEGSKPHAAREGAKPSSAPERAQRPEKPPKPRPRSEVKDQHRANNGSSHRRDLGHGERARQAHGRLGAARQRGPEALRGRHQDLPAMTAEDIADALANGGYDDSPIPRHVSNTSPYGARRVRGQASDAPAPPTRRLETLSPSSESVAALAALEGVLDEVVPLQAKHRAALRGDIRKLWEELTSDRESRNADYLGTAQALSAYLRYFLPWNVYRLSSLLTNADFCLPDRAVVVDIGSGPLTLPIALWVSRPELRDLPITFYCLDRVERVLEAGYAIFQTLCMRVDGRLPPWRIETRKDHFGAPIPERAHLVTAANVFNEFFWKEKGSLGERAIDTARTLLGYLRENGSLFVMEPGDPRSGAFVSALRAALIAEGAPPLGPCPHSLSCPMPGVFRHLLPPESTRTVRGDPNYATSRFILQPVAMPKNRDKYPWCHFGVDALKAPTWLEALSEEAGLPKERAVLSFLWAARGPSVRAPIGLADPLRVQERDKRAKAGHGVLVRVVSDPFPLPDGSTGQYACSSLGYTLLKRPRGEPSFDSGDLLEVPSAPLQRNDEKSGAIILPT